VSGRIAIIYVDLGPQFSPKNELLGIVKQNFLQAGLVMDLVSSKRKAIGTPMIMLTHKHVPLVQ